MNRSLVLLLLSGALFAGPDGSPAPADLEGAIAKGVAWLRAQAKGGVFAVTIQGEEVPTPGHTALALGNVYGPRQDPHGEAGVIAIFAGRMMAGEGCTINGDGNQTRDYVFVSDTVDAFSRALDRGSGKLINVGTGLETSVNLLYRMLAEILGVDEEPELGPLPTGEVRRIALDISMAESELGWRPWTHLEDGLGETVAYMKGV